MIKIKDEIDNVCASLFSFAIFLYNENIKIEKRLNVNLIYARVKETLKNIRYDHRGLLLALYNTDHVMDVNYIYSHTVRTTITHTGITKILKNQDKYNGAAIKALVNSLSIYPIGSNYCRLNY